MCAMTDQASKIDPKILNSDRVQKSLALNAQGFLAADKLRDKPEPKEIREISSLGANGGVCLSYVVRAVQSMSNDQLKDQYKEQLTIKPPKNDFATGLSSTMTVAMGASALALAYMTKESFKNFSAPIPQEKEQEIHAQATEVCVGKVVKDYAAQIEPQVKKSVIDPEAAGFTKTGAQMKKAVELCVPNEALNLQNNVREGHIGVIGACASGFVLTAVFAAYAAVATRRCFAVDRARAETNVVVANNTALLKTHMDKRGLVL
jgi:hypothetical protein